MDVIRRVLKKRREVTVAIRKGSKKIANKRDLFNKKLQTKHLSLGGQKVEV